MRPGLTQADLAAVDQFKLDGLLAKALSRREAYESAIRDIEQLIGMDRRRDGIRLGWGYGGVRRSDGDCPCPSGPGWRRCGRGRRRGLKR